MFACAALHSYADIAVSDVKVFSGYPWKEVAICYTVSGNAENKVFRILASAKDNKSGKTYQCKTLVGASTTDGKHVIKWNAAADGVRFKSDDVNFTVKVVDPLYCIIDLSGGTSASRYPLTGLADIPSGGWTDEYKTTKLVLRRIEAGTFKMQNRYNVTLTKPFYISVFEVSQKQWELVVGSNPSENSYGKGANYPVHNVNYHMIRGSSAGIGWPSSSSVDSTSFIGKLRAKTGLDTLDLPTEAQWEYACRAGTTTTYYWGDSMSDDYAWHYSNSGGKAHPIGVKKPNDWGLYDMSGNVDEWCLDFWSSVLRSGTDPKGASSSDGGKRVLRGGSWCSGPEACTSSYREFRCGPSGEEVDYKYGLRIVGSLSK